MAESRRGATALPEATLRLATKHLHPDSGASRARAALSAPAPLREPRGAGG